MARAPGEVVVKPFVTGAVRIALVSIYAVAVYTTLLLGFDLAVRAPLPFAAWLRMLVPYRLALAAALGCAAAGAGVWAWRFAGSRLAPVLARIDPDRGDRRVLAGTMLAGVLVRAAWVAGYPAPQTSDGAAYMDLAVKLAGGQPYYIAGQLGGFAFWPPGMPLILTPWVAMFGPAPWIPVALNLILFAALALACDALGRRLFNARVAAVAVAALAVWPNHVAATGLVQKELLLAPGLALALLWFDMALEHDSPGARRLSPWLLAALAGAVLGLCSLAQPATWMMLWVFVLVALWRPARIARRAAVLAVLSGFMVITIAPWTIRNALVTGEFVMVSANAGSAIYGGNNPVNTGEIADRGNFIEPAWPLDWRTHTDVERDRACRALAVQWIRENPARFAQLTLQRVMLTLGDDSDAVYRSLRLGLGVSTPVYVSWKAAVNTFWLVAVVLTLPWLAGRAGRLPGSALVIVGTLMIHPVVLHDFVEGGSRHHMGTLWCYALLLGAALVAAGGGSVAGRHSEERTASAGGH